MEPIPGIESEGEYPRLVLSMRTKVSLLGLCFVLLVSFVAYSNMPNVVEALRSMGPTSPQQDQRETERQTGLLWEQTYPILPTSEGAFSADLVLQRPNGYLVVGGNVTTDGMSRQIYLVRIDSQGNCIWEKTVAGTIWDYAQCAENRDNGNVLLAGAGDHGQQIFLMEIDERGDTVWKKEFRVGGNFRGLTGPNKISPCPTDDGGFLVVNDTMMFKLDKDGRKLWEVPVGPFVAVEASTGGFYGAWRQNPSEPQPGLWQVTLGRYDNSLKLQWELPFGLFDPTSTLLLIETEDGGVLAVFPSVSNFRPNAIVMRRLDPEGKLLWETNFTAGSPDLIHFLQAHFELEDGGFIIPGHAGGLAGRYYKRTHSFIIRIDPDGKMTWSQVYESDTLGQGFEMDDGFVFLDGPTVIRLDPLGHRIWEYEGNWTGGDVVRTSSGDFLLAGSTLVEGREEEVASLVMISVGDQPPVPEICPDEVIYDEGREAWTLDPEPNLQVDTASTITKTNGNVSMSLTNQRLAYIDFHSPQEQGFNTYGYASIDLWLNRGNCSTFMPQLVVEMSHGPNSYQDLTKIASFPQNEWVHITLTLKDLGAWRQIIRTIRIGGYTPGTYYVDNLRFVFNIPEFAVWAATILLICARSSTSKWQPRNRR